MPEAVGRGAHRDWRRVWRHELVAIICEAAGPGADRAAVEAEWPAVCRALSDYARIVRINQSRHAADSNRLKWLRTIRSEGRVPVDLDAERRSLLDFGQFIGGTSNISEAAGSVLRFLGNRGRPRAHRAEIDAVVGALARMAAAAEGRPMTAYRLRTQYRDGLEYTLGAMSDGALKRLTERALR